MIAPLDRTPDLLRRLLVGLAASVALLPAAAFAASTETVPDAPNITDGRLYDLLRQRATAVSTHVRPSPRRAQSQRADRGEPVAVARSTAATAEATQAAAKPAKAEPAKAAVTTAPKAPKAKVAVPAIAEAEAEPVKAPAPAPAAPAPAPAEPAPATPSVDARGGAGTVFARVAGQEIVLPAEAVAVGFHESGSAASLPMEPIGTPLHNQNAGRIALPPASAGNRYFVLPTRGRANGPTSAVDVRVEPGTPLASVVDGTVKTVSDYSLYGRTPDQIVEITPAGRPDLEVRIMHIEDVKVAPGDVVEAGETIVAGSSRQLPFESQIDRFSSVGPHVHVEVNHQPEA